ncbi:DEAD-domain-containing protein [Trichocladium antarcticum]|uniref:ATP-dependent RNA helicase n=1 Tax=Trichocladium antarcticum TaxID=1450529 RepID=A0AAN6UL71_9PEZI|nr:DEAD-domain-containing protein [Trichocladium antarcticum]
MAIDKKRKRADAPVKDTKPPATKPKRQKNNVGKRVTSVNSLQWKTVDVPEMFDDAEGFYGLEEVEGVEIVRDGDMVRFVAAGTAPESDDGDDFEGFDDAPVEAEESPEKPPPSTGAAAPGSAKEGSKTQKKDPKSKDKKETKPNEKREKKALKEKKDPKPQEKKDPRPQEKKDPKPPKEKKAAKAQEAQSDPELEANVFAQAGDIAEAEADNEDIDMSEWNPLELSSQMLSSLARLKFDKPTAIQAQSIPEIVNGRDLVGKAATGSGKTLAFGIPIVESWLAKTAAAKKADEARQPTALILAPTRELAHQISDHLKQLCAGLAASPYICSVTGGLSVHKQQRQLEKADIVIATPGRLWEVMSSGKSVLQALRGISFLVVDEADRLLQDGHFKEVEEIIKALDRITTEEDDGEDSSDDDDAAPGSHRQTLVFSATFNKALQQKLAGKARFNLSSDAESMEYLLKKLNFREARPMFVDTNPISQMAENLKEGLIQCGDLEKDLYLYAVLMLQPTHRALVFTNSINTVRRLTPFLQALNLPAFALHSDMEQKARLRSIERFKGDTKSSSTATPTTQQQQQQQQQTILVATDVAARGLDIPNIDLVIHYHVPRSADDYVHRSGRTARAHKSGVSVLLCGPKEAVSTTRLVAKVHARAAAATHLSRKKLRSLGVQTVDIDRRLVSHLRPRVVLAKKITETSLAKERGAKEDDWMKTAAEELGVDVEDAAALALVGSWKGRGSGRKAKEREAMETSKAEMQEWRWELKELLAKRVNTGVSERYLGGVDVEGLLKGAAGEFLGVVEGLGL